MWLILALILDNIFMLIALISAGLLIPDFGKWGDTTMGMPIRLVVLFTIFIVCIIGDVIKRKKEDEEGV